MICCRLMAGESLQRGLTVCSRYLENCQTDRLLSLAKVGCSRCVLCKCKSQSAKLRTGVILALVKTWLGEVGVASPKMLASRSRKTVADSYFPQRFGLVTLPRFAYTQSASFGELQYIELSICSFHYRSWGCCCPGSIVCYMLGPT